MIAISVPRVPVLMYHEVADPSATSSTLAVSPGVFADQVAYLQDAGFTAITAGELSAILSGGEGELPERPVVLTFDDGYENFYSQALPRLVRHGFTSTVFVTTGRIGKDDAHNRMLNWQEIADAEQSGVEIGAHTCKHPQLDLMTAQEVREELGVSKSALEEHLGHEVPGLAYPFGYANEMVRQVAVDLGYAYGYRVGNALTTSRAGKFMLPRLTVKRDTSMEDFRRMVNGEDTLNLRRSRMLSRGYSVVRRAKMTLGLARQPDFYYW